MQALGFDLTCWWHFLKFHPDKCSGQKKNKFFFSRDTICTVYVTERGVSRLLISHSTTTSCLDLWWSNTWTSACKIVLPNRHTTTGSFIVLTELKYIMYSPHICTIQFYIPLIQSSTVNILFPFSLSFLFTIQFLHYQYLFQFSKILKPIFAKNLVTQVKFHTLKIRLHYNKTYPFINRRFIFNNRIVICVAKNPSVLLLFLECMK